MARKNKNKKRNRNKSESSTPQSSTPPVEDDTRLLVRGGASGSNEPRAQPRSPNRSKSAGNDPEYQRLPEMDTLSVQEQGAAAGGSPTSSRDGSKYRRLPEMDALSVPGQGAAAGGSPTSSRDGSKYQRLPEMDTLSPQDQGAAAGFPTSSRDDSKYRRLPKVDALSVPGQGAAAGGSPKKGAIDKARETYARKRSKSPECVCKDKKNHDPECTRLKRLSEGGACESSKGKSGKAREKSTSPRSTKDQDSSQGATGGASPRKSPIVRMKNLLVGKSECVCKNKMNHDSDCSESKRLSAGDECGSPKVKSGKTKAKRPSTKSTKDDDSTQSSTSSNPSSRSTADSDKNRLAVPCPESSSVVHEKKSESGNLQWLKSMFRASKRRSNPSDSGGSFEDKTDNSDSSERRKDPKGKSPKRSHSKSETTSSSGISSKDSTTSSGNSRQSSSKSSSTGDYKFLKCPPKKKQSKGKEESPSRPQTDYDPQEGTSMPQTDYDPQEGTSRPQTDKDPREGASKGKDWLPIQWNVVIADIREEPMNKENPIMEQVEEELGPTGTRPRSRSASNYFFRFPSDQQHQSPQLDRNTTLTGNLERRTAPINRPDQQGLMAQAAENRPAPVLEEERFPIGPSPRRRTQSTTDRRVSSDRRSLSPRRPLDRNVNLAENLGRMNLVAENAPINRPDEQGLMAEAAENRPAHVLEEEHDPSGLSPRRRSRSTSSYSRRVASDRRPLDRNVNLARNPQRRPAPVNQLDDHEHEQGLLARVAEVRPTATVARHASLSPQRNGKCSCKSKYVHEVGCPKMTEMYRRRSKRNCKQQHMINKERAESSD